MVNDIMKKSIWKVIFGLWVCLAVTSGCEGQNKNTFQVKEKKKLNYNVFLNCVEINKGIMHSSYLCPMVSD